MKIRLERAPAQKILHVTEAMTPQDLDVLSAGAAKLVASEPKHVVFELTLATGPDLIQFFKDMRIALSSLGGAVFFVGPQAGTDAPSLEELSKKLADPLARVLLLEEQLKAAETVLTARKAELDKQLAASQASDPRAVQKEITALKRSHAAQEKIIFDLVKRAGQKALGQSPTTHPPLATLTKALDEILKAQGVMA